MKELAGLLPQLEQQHGLPAGLLQAVMMTESGGNPRAVSPRGASGPFQFMPATAREYGIDPFNPQQSAQAAAKKLAGLTKMYQGDTTKALQAYNWGEGNMASGKPMPAETQAYAGKVFKNMGGQMPANSDREELMALRRLAELEAKAAGGQPEQQAAKPQSNGGSIAADLFGGLVRGAAGIGAALKTPVAEYDPKTGNRLPGSWNDRRKATLAEVDAGLSSLVGSNPDSMAYSGGKLVSEVAGTMGVGGVLAGGARAAGAAPSVVNALSTAGFRTGNAPATMAGKATDMALRAGAGAATGGASAALINPDDAATGAALGGALPGVAKGVGSAFGAAGRVVRPNVNNPELAQKAIQQYGIPLGVADISGSSVTKAIRSVLNDAPLTSGVGARQGERVQQGFNRAVGQTFGADAPVLTPKVLDAAKQRMGAEFDRIWGQNVLEVDAGLFQQFQGLRTSAQKLPQGEASRLSSWLDDIESKMVPGPNGAPTIPGDVANRLQSKLRQDAEKATGFLKSDLQDLRKSVIAAFNRSVSPADAAALSKNMGQYKAYKTVQPLLEGAEAGVAGREAGNIPAALLPQAVRKSYGANIAGSPLGDLSQIGSQYVADRVARTGGSTRAAIQNSAIVSALGVGGLHNPLAAIAAIPAGMATNALLGSPRLAAAAANANPNAFLMLPQELQIQLLRAAPALIPDR